MINSSALKVLIYQLSTKHLSRNKEVQRRVEEKRNISAEDLG